MRKPHCAMTRWQAGVHSHGHRQSYVSRFGSGEVPVWLKPDPRVGLSVDLDPTAIRVGGVCRCGRWCPAQCPGAARGGVVRGVLVVGMRRRLQAEVSSSRILASAVGSRWCPGGSRMVRRRPARTTRAGMNRGRDAAGRRGRGVLIGSRSGPGATPTSCRPAARPTSTRR